ncbi:oligosaccharide flippase family protein [Lutimonas halocynthiae]|uniref:oligosaccharide flippase family protein n=1 Tax=Lutimonas halocynthiae TaxID=1446477 RepID=UPI0025B61373|nr:oligosaccharide flippase family protein [Lutimonas halocynthiae]MDN3643377.1 oligosaccharide flippase family protein [Lutimonas halocynthiae]
MELKILAKNTVILASPKVLKFVVGILRAKFVAIYLGTVGAGIIDQLVYIINQIRNVSLASLPDGMVKLIAEQNGKGFDVVNIAKIIKTYILMVIPLTIMMTVLGYYFSDVITLYVFGDIKYKTYFQIGFLAFPVTVLTTTARAPLKAFKEIKSFAITEILVISINLMIFIPLIYFFKIPGAVVYVTLSYVTAFFVTYFLMRKNVMIKYNISFGDIKKAVFDKPIFKQLMSYMGVGVLGGTFFIFTEITTRSIVVNELGINQLGIYSPITAWAGLFVGFILPSVYTYLYPRLSESKTDEEIIRVINAVIRLITFVALPFIIVGISIRDWIIPLFYSMEFIEATNYLPFHFGSLMFFIWSSILSQLFYATGRLKSYLIFGLTINTISLLLVYYLVPIIGLFGYMAKFTIIPLLTLVTYFLFWRYEIKLRLESSNIQIVVYTFLCSIILLLLKDTQIYLQVVGFILIGMLYFLLRKKEKDFIMKKVSGIFKRNN